MSLLIFLLIFLSFIVNVPSLIEAFNDSESTNSSTSIEPPFCLRRLSVSASRIAANGPTRIAVCEWLLVFNDFFNISVGVVLLTLKLLF